MNPSLPILIEDWDVMNVCWNNFTKKIKTKKISEQGVYSDVRYTDVYIGKTFSRPYLQVI